MKTSKRVGRIVRPYLPVPKVYVPGLAGLGGCLVAWIATGEFDRTELAIAVGSLWYATIGWATPGS